MTEIPENLFVTCEVVLDWPTLHEAQLRRNPEPKDKPQFTGTFLFTHAAMKSPEVAAILAGVHKAGVAHFGKAAFEAMVREESYASPFRKDLSAKGYDPDVYSRFITSAANEAYPPGIFARSGVAITEPRDIRAKFYAGCKVRVSIVPRAYGGGKTGYKPGIKLDMRNVQFLAEGERIVHSGASSGGNEFSKLPDEEVGGMPGTVDEGPDAEALARMMG